MTQRTPQRFAAAAALAAVLFLTAAAPAQARDLGPAPRAWQWLQELWIKGTSVLWNWSEPAVPAPGFSGELRKEGPGSDPNGAPSPGPSSATPACDTCGDAGPGSDPDG
jgi:hypothetical protein